MNIIAGITTSTVKASTLFDKIKTISKRGDGWDDVHQYFDDIDGIETVGRDQGDSWDNYGNETPLDYKFNLDISFGDDLKYAVTNDGKAFDKLDKFLDKCLELSKDHDENDVYPELTKYAKSL